MIFNYTLGIPEPRTLENSKINYREAVRGIIIKDSRILMVSSNKGDYKFPGGGLNKGESHEEALKREVEEETGYIVSVIKDKLGQITERRIDEYEKDSFFEMNSYYYHCEVSDKKVNQKLDEYESELDFRPVWIQIDDVIKLNEDLFKNAEKDKNAWLQRETLVLKALKDKMTNTVD